jgi:hypothetical protein
LRTYRRTGNVRSAVRERKCFGPWQGPVLWLLRGSRAFRGIGTLPAEGIFLDKGPALYNIRNHY